MFHLFQTYVASVSSGCCKSRSECCIYMQVFQMFPYVCCKWFHLNVFNVGNGYTRGFQVFLVYHKCFRHMLQVFQLFRTYVANVFSRCYKSKYGCCTCCSGSHLLQLLGLPACVWVWRRRERDTWGRRSRRSAAGHTEWCGTWCGCGTRSGAGPHVKWRRRTEASPHPNIRALAFPFFYVRAMHQRLALFREHTYCLWFWT
jgi:hypothetical protein